MKGANRLSQSEKLPYKVTKDDVEVFILILGSSGPACICSWKLALDWTSGGRSGERLLTGNFAVSEPLYLTQKGVKNGYYEQVRKMANGIRLCQNSHTGQHCPCSCQRCSAGYFNMNQSYDKGSKKQARRE